MRRRFAVAAAALALSVALTVPAYAGTWKYVNDQWKYQKGTNKFAYNEWIKDNGKYYYIGNDGIMKTGCSRSMASGIIWTRLVQCRSDG